MAKIGYEAPSTVGEMLDLINQTQRFHLSLISTGGAIVGHLNTAFGRKHTPPTGKAVLIEGELDDDAHPLFSGDSDEAALTFVQGIFLGVFGGRGLEAIQDELTRRPERFNR